MGSPCLVENWLGTHFLRQAVSGTWEEVVCSGVGFSGAATRGSRRTVWSELLSSCSWKSFSDQLLGGEQRLKNQIYSARGKGARFRLWGEPVARKPSPGLDLGLLCDLGRVPSALWFLVFALTLEKAWKELPGFPLPAGCTPPTVCVVNQVTHTAYHSALQRKCETQRP